MAKKKPAAKPAKAASAAPTAHADGAPGIDIGLSAGERRKIAEGLGHMLADAFTLYLKTHNFHWNISGPMFNSLHVMFEGQYTEQWNALDEIAERMRALGYNAPGSYPEFIKLGSIKEEPGLADAADGRELGRRVGAEKGVVSPTARRAVKTADAAGDDPTVDLMTQRLQTHEKYAWMLRSLLQ